MDTVLKHKVFCLIQIGLNKQYVFIPDNTIRISLLSASGFI